jgi:hypothetical protein
MLATITAFALDHLLYGKKLAAESTPGPDGMVVTPPSELIATGAQVAAGSPLPVDQSLADPQVFHRALRLIPPDQRARLLDKKMTMAELGPLLMKALKSQKSAVGKRAPDFTLPTVGEGQRKVHLAELVARRPVVLLFGSFHCRVFCGQLNRLTRLYDTYKNRAEFLFIHVAEPPQPNRVLPVPENFLEHIREGLKRFKLPFCCLADSQDARVQDAYSVFIQGLFIVDQDCQVVLDSGAGLPNGWNLDEAEEFLKRLPPTP